jgi:undecaprenyl-diphosphatase
VDLNGLDTLLLVFVNKSLHIAALAPVAAAVTRNPHMVMLALFAVVALKEEKKVIVPFAVAAAAVLAAYLLTGVLKQLLHRPRPCDVLEGINLLVGCPGSFAMPSGHASGTFAFAVPFYFFVRSGARHALLAGAALVSASRVYVGVHYPSDVLAGAALGSAVAAVLSVAYLGLSAGMDRRKRDPRSDTIE